MLRPPGAPRPASTAVGPGDKPAPCQLWLIAWRRLVKGPLRGFCPDELLALKPWIMQCTALISPCRAWCAPRAKLQDHDSTGRQKSDASGKARCAAVLQWCTASLADRFNRAVIVAIWRAPAP
jgi:hypothetical protein